MKHEPITQLFTSYFYNIHFGKHFFFGKGNLCFIFITDDKPQKQKRQFSFVERRTDPRQQQLYIIFLAVVNLFTLHKCHNAKYELLMISINFAYKLMLLGGGN